MSDWSCPFEEGHCRSENNKKECCSGGFFYRCADLNTTDHYKEALEKALQYDFDRIRSYGVRTKWDFYQRRKKIEDSGKACQGCRDKDTEAFECKCQYLRENKKCLKINKKKLWADRAEYGIFFYQLPVSDSYQGRVDLVLKTKGADELFMTEYKPEREEKSETILRMICEIVTYCKTVKEGAIDFFGGKRGKWSGEKLNLKPENIHPAIMFKEESPQYQQWKERDPKIDLLIEKHNISVFIVKDDTILRLK